jgi:hypothetical protein
VRRALHGDVRGQRFPGWPGDGVAGRKDRRRLGGDLVAGAAELAGDKRSRSTARAPA